MEDDLKLDRAYRIFVRTVLDRERSKADGVDAVFTLLTISRAMERIGDLCTNIAEDIIFLSTGEIVRHGLAGGLEEDESAADERLG
jgi:phosphate transport system protein